MAAKKFTDEERAAMRERAKELKKGPDTEADVLAKIAEMADADRVLAERVHELIKAGAPDITPKLWYGMPTYTRNGKVLCHFQPAAKFKTRFATLTFSDQASLDDGAMWPVSFALTAMTADAEERIAALLKQA
jgi:hypothetical protein